MRDLAIYNTHPTVIRIIESRDAYDADSNLVALDEGLITAEITRLEGLQAQTQAEAQVKANAEAGAVTGFQTLPAFLKTMTGDEVVTHIHGAVLGGKTEAQINADIDGLANTVAGMKVGLKTIGASLIAIRDILELVAKLLLYIRDLVLKYRN